MLSAARMDFISGITCLQQSTYQAAMKFFSRSNEETEKVLALTESPSQVVSSMYI